MYLYTAYCGSRDQDVCIAMDRELSEAEKHDLAIICMKYSWAPICTADFCPNFGSGYVAMGVRTSRET